MVTKNIVVVNKGGDLKMSLKTLIYLNYTKSVDSEKLMVLN